VDCGSAPINTNYSKDYEIKIRGTKGSGYGGDR